jgi:hypothetical protein
MRAYHTPFTSSVPALIAATRGATMDGMNREDRLPGNLVLSLVAVQAVAFATLMRSVLFERWTTVVASLVLLVGANAALRARTWGIGVVLAVAAAFAGAVLLGFAPSWFYGVGILGAIPFVLTVRPMARFDAGATALFTMLAGGTAVAAAYAWREAAYAIFYALYVR